MGFLTHWLIGEYESEKEELQLQQNNEFFKGILFALETDSVNEVKFEDPFYEEDRGLLSIKVDTMRNNILRIEKQESINTTLGIETIGSFKEQYKVIRGDTMRITGEARLNEETKEIDTFYNIDINKKLSDNDEEIIFLSDESQISTRAVLQRMMPKFLISLLIIGSVIGSFIVLARSLSRQRELTELKNDFMANMTHELKTPVSTISVALEALKDFGVGENPKLREEYMDITISEANRLGMLVDKALNISLFEKGRVHFANEEIDLKHEVLNIERTLKVYHEHHNVEFNVESIGERFMINGDKSHLVNVIHNLIENAMKYSKEKKRISVTLEELSDRIELKIQDNGIGISNADQERIFQKFYRVTKGNVHDTKGHGLGLSYVKMAVEEMRGKIKVDSIEGEGSRFILTFPKLML